MIRKVGLGLAVAALLLAGCKQLPGAVPSPTSSPLPASAPTVKPSTPPSAAPTFEPMPQPPVVTPTPHAGPTPTPTAKPSDPPPLGNGAGNCNSGSGNANAINPSAGCNGGFLQAQLADTPIHLWRLNETNPAANNTFADCGGGYASPPPPSVDYIDSAPGMCADTGVGNVNPGAAPLSSDQQYSLSFNVINANGIQTSASDTQLTGAFSVEGLVSLYATASQDTVAASSSVGASDGWNIKSGFSLYAGTGSTFNVGNGTTIYTATKSGVLTDMSPCTDVHTCTPAVHHLVGVFTGTQVILYVDNVKFGPTTFTGTFAPFAAAPPGIMLGAAPCGSVCGGGRSVRGGAYLQSVAIYNVALSATQVQNHYCAINATICAGVTPTPSPQPVPMTPNFTYAQGATGCGGNYDRFSAGAAQDVFWGFFLCASDPDKTTLFNDCAPGGNCRAFLYVSPSQVDCNPAMGVYPTIYNNPGASDVNFIHTGTPHTISNRLFANGGKCDKTGGATGTFTVYPNMAQSTVTTWEINNEILPASFLNGSTWHGLFHDNQSMLFPAQVLGFTANEYPSVASWRNTGIAAHLNALAPYGEVINSEGPGNGSYPHNNGTGTGAGIVNWAIDDKDICDNLNASAKTAVKAFMFEKLLGNPATVSSLASDYMWPSNIKTAVNTAAQHWNDSNCTNIALAISGMTGQKGTTSWPQRALGVVLRGLMTRSGYDCARTTANIVMGTRFPSYIQQYAGATGQQTVYPEDELCMAQPYVALTNWVCGTGSNGGCFTNADSLGGGCQAGDSGGVAALAQLCGSVGTGPDGGTAPVYVREFQACNRLGTNIGPCAVVANMSTTANITVSQLALNNTYVDELTPTGGELYTDPVNPANGNLCSSNATIPGSACNGAWTETAITQSTVIPHCTVINPGSNNAVINAMVSNGCFVVLLHQ